MRIRSIRPEFWTSQAISSLALEDRLLFIGLWSYVDDNGVGLDRLSLIATDLFPDDIERDPRETFARVSRGLAHLSAAGRITRYTVENREYLSITNWEEHQRIDRPGKSRYPLPTSPNTEIRESVARVSRDPIDMPPTGEGEKGRRGEGEKTLTVTADADAPTDDRTIETDFNEWWSHYPRKVSKGQALRAYKTARKKTNHTTLLEALKKQTPTITATEPKYRPHASTWLNGERWNDELPGLAATATTPVTDPFLDEHGNYRAAPAHPENPERWEDEPA